MKDNFDLKKYLKDNKVIEKSNKYVAATLNEEEAKKETPKKEKIEENVDLKSKIKEMVLAELSEDVELEEYGKSYEEDNVDEASCGYEEDGMDEAMSKKKKSLDDGIKTADKYMNEAEDDVETDESEDVETEEEVEVVDAEDIPAETDTPTDTGGIMGNLEAAIEKARELGDEKLIDQIGNTITFYTRQYISK
jgi:hypothetical protein